MYSDSKLIRLAHAVREIRKLGNNTGVLIYSDWLNWQDFKIIGNSFNLKGLQVCFIPVEDSIKQIPTVSECECCLNKEFSHVIYDCSGYNDSLDTLLDGDNTERVIILSDYKNGTEYSSIADRAIEVSETGVIKTCGGGERGL